MKIRGIIEALLSSHERGSDDYIAGYILRSSEGRLGQEQAQHFATMFNDYAQFIYSPVSYNGIYKKVFESLGTEDFGTGICKYIEQAGLGSFEDGEDFPNGLDAVESVLVHGNDVDSALEQVGLDPGEEVVDGVETGVSRFWEPRFERTIEPEDGYSDAEIEELTRVIEDEL